MKLCTNNTWHHSKCSEKCLPIVISDTRMAQNLPCTRIRVTQCVPCNREEAGVSLGCCRGTPLGVVGAVTCPLPRRVLWVWSHGTHGTDTGPSTQTHTRPVLTNLDHGDARGSPSPRRGRDKRENRELFREGVEGWGTKIRPLVPKKTLAPSKALERGSSARNVTPGRASAGLGNEVSLRDPCKRQAGGPGTSPPTARLQDAGWSWF